MITSSSAFTIFLYKVLAFCFKKSEKTRNRNKLSKINRKKLKNKLKMITRREIKASHVDEFSVFTRKFIDVFFVC